MKLYKYDYSGGHSLGGYEYGPGTEWHVADDDNVLRYAKRDGVDNTFWEQTGYERNPSPSYKFICDIDEDTVLSIDAKYISEREIVAKIGRETEEKFNKIKTNTITYLEI